MSQLNVNIIKNRVGSNGPTISGNTNVSGILTATSFSGDGSGLTSLIISGDGNLTNLNVSGVSTFTGNTEFDGNVTIGGTLTYRDVTNIDAVGMITARKGVQILADGFTVTGVSTLSNGAFIPDSQYLNIGNDSDLRLYHTGTASFIEDQGTGNFIIGSNGGVLKITKGADTEDMAVFTPDGSAALYYDNAKKLETSTTGVTVTGDVTATSFSGDLTGTASNASGATGDFSIADKIVHTGDTNTAIRFPAADTFTVETAGTEQVRIDSSGRLLVGTSSTSSTALLQVQGNSSSSTGGAILQLRRGTNNAGIINNTALGSIEFSNTESTISAVIAAEADANWNTTNDYPSRLVFSTTADGASSPTERLRITSAGAAIFKGGLAEKYENAGTTLGAQTDNPLSDGNVILFTGNESSGTLTINFTGVHATLSNGETVSFTAIITPNGTGIITIAQVDGQAITIKWSGGSAPSAGASGQDIYTFQILKTGTGVSDYTIIGAAVNYA